MLPGHAPKRLRDVSHLFLSRNDSEKNKAAGGVEVAVWLATQGDTLNRAHCAAGIARALAAQRIYVTVLELGRGLPNVGYYFALEPDEYLAQILDESQVISGESGPYIRYSIAVEPRRFPFAGRKTLPVDSPHVILTAFTCPPTESYREFFAELGGTTVARGRNTCEENGIPDGFMLITDGCNSGRDEAITRFFVGAIRQPVVFVARPSGGAVGDYGADEMVTLPPDIRATWVKRVPPACPFFSDFTASFLQMVSLKRRRDERDAV